MPYGVMQDMPGVSEEHYRLVERNLGPDRPPGLLAQAAGPVDGGWRIVALWQDEAAFRRFQSERLMKAAGIAAQDPGFDPSLAAGFTALTVDGDDLPFA